MLSVVIFAQNLLSQASSFSHILSHQGSWLKLKSFKVIQAKAVQLFLSNKTLEEGDIRLPMRKYSEEQLLESLSNQMQWNRTLRLSGETKWKGTTSQRRAFCRSSEVLAQL